MTIRLITRAPDAETIKELADAIWTWAPTVAASAEELYPQLKIVDNISRTK